MEPVILFLKLMVYGALALVLFPCLVHEAGHLFAGVHQGCKPVGMVLFGFCFMSYAGEDGRKVRRIFRDRSAPALGCSAVMLPPKGTGINARSVVAGAEVLSLAAAAVISATAATCIPGELSWMLYPCALVCMIMVLGNRLSKKCDGGLADGWLMKELRRNERASGDYQEIMRIQALLAMGKTYAECDVPECDSAETPLTAELARCRYMQDAERITEYGPDTCRAMLDRLDSLGQYESFDIGTMLAERSFWNIMLYGRLNKEVCADISRLAGQPHGAGNTDGRFVPGAAVGGLLRSEDPLKVMLAGVVMCGIYRADPDEIIERMEEERRHVLYCGEWDTALLRLKRSIANLAGDGNYGK